MVSLKILLGNLTWKKVYISAYLKKNITSRVEITG